MHHWGKIKELDSDVDVIAPAAVIEGIRIRAIVRGLGEQVAVLTGAERELIEEAIYLGTRPPHQEIPRCKRESADLDAHDRELSDH